MARNHAKLLSSVWREPEWTCLGRDAQWLYVLLLSQQKLTLVGSLDVSCARWATLAAGTTRPDIEAALEALEAARMVVVDRDTDELVVRTFTRHDLDPNRVNVNLAKGLWGHWGNMTSSSLRTLVVHEMPDALWDRLEPHAPTDATRIRRSARLEPAAPSPVRTGTALPGSNGEPPSRFEPPLSSHLSPSTSHPRAEASPVRTDEPLTIAPEQVSHLRQLRYEMTHRATPAPDPAEAG